VADRVGRCTPSNQTAADVRVCQAEIVCRAGREALAADLHGAGQPVQCRPGTRLETDDEVDAEPFVRVDRAGQLAGEADERPAAGLARISHLAVHAYCPAQRGRVAAFGLQRRVHAGQPLA
jgi:hypothetical protein